MKYYIYCPLFFLFFSCKKDSTNTYLEKIYKTSAQNENDSLKIGGFNILRKKKVNHDYILKVQINNLKQMIDLYHSIIDKEKLRIDLSEKNINRGHRLIILNPKKKEKYLYDNQNNQQDINKSKLKIKEIEDKIAIIHQRIVLKKAENESNKRAEFELIEYVFTGKINDEKHMDTISVLKGYNNLFQFIKNGRFTNYKGE